ncbi:hypothetical protein THRCLA_11899 [Thraustotheca clavata]|uniref:GPI transamidase component PIG-S n=1 Tax=Thraustotheca clavata TaxID=74557 RepID=A0A1V9Y5J6_9STRA|nr:hypothetical protein THRCLA_11899 [Thraustotheca clavata]
MAGTRLMLLLSMLVPLLLLIAPFAYRLTLVPRAPLPLNAIAALDVAALDTALSSKLSNSQYLTLWSSSPTTFDVLSSVQKHSALFSIGANENLDAALLNLVQKEGLQDTFVVFLLCTTNEIAPVTLGIHRHGWTEACSLTKQVQEEIYQIISSMKNVPSIRTTLKYRWSFTFMNELPGMENNYVWENQMKLQALEYIEPLVDLLTPLAKFTVESEMVHYAALAKTYHYDDESKEYYVTADDLQQFKSANDYATVSLLDDREQLIHFMAALPSSSHSPLVVRTKSKSKESSQSFIIPGYGGIAILDPSSEPREQIHKMMEVAVAQLRHFLGLHSKPISTSSITQLPAKYSGMALWERDILARFWLEKHWHSTLSALTSIGKLVNDMPQIIVLPRIQTQVNKAIKLIENTTSAIDTPSSLSALNTLSMLKDLREAVDVIESAYYDSTMVAQLYFPEEHIYAVYLPLILPLVLPFGFGLVREVKRYKKKQASK